MAEELEGSIGLVEFLTDLRAELSEAQSRAVGQSLKLGIEEITLTLDVAYTLSKGGEASAGVKAKFWVLEFGQVGVKGSASSKRAHTQRLTLTLKPRTEEVIVNEKGQRSTATRGVDITGVLGQGEERPELPDVVPRRG